MQRSTAKQNPVPPCQCQLNRANMYYKITIQAKGELASPAPPVQCIECAEEVSATTSLKGLISKHRVSRDPSKGRDFASPGLLVTKMCRLTSRTKCATSIANLKRQVSESQIQPRRDGFLQPLCKKMKGIQRKDSRGALLKLT